MSVHWTIDETVSPIEFRASLEIMVFPIRANLEGRDPVPVVDEQASFWRAITGHFRTPDGDAATMRFSVRVRGVTPAEEAAIAPMVARAPHLVIAEYGSVVREAAAWVAGQPGQPSGINLVL